MYLQPGYVPPASGYPGYRPSYGPRVYDYVGGPIPRGAVLESRINRGLVVGGAVVFGTLYAISLIVALSIDLSSACSPTCPNRDYRWLYAPVFGPFVHAGVSHLDPGTTGILIIDGLGQVAGAVMLIAGLAIRRQVVVVPEYGQGRAAPRSRSARWTLAPGAPRAPLGLSLTLAGF
jgi:hypothetical protein